MFRMFWLILSSSFFVLPGTLGAVINVALNATPIDRLDRPTYAAKCVNDTEHPTWGPVQEFDFTGCQRAVELTASRLEDKLYTSYDFYSRQVYPHAPGHTGDEAWALGIGAGADGCALVIRMTRDFANDALPISASRFAPTANAQAVQQNSWLFILRAIKNLLSVCVHGSGLPGWSMETKNIVVALWPRKSVMNEKYGIRIISSQPDMDTSWLLLNSE